jgi:type II secretory pathway pseudopilin PulG
VRVRRSSSGDTIIEVLFAITVFSLVAVGSLSLMNQGTALAQSSLEIGLVRQQMDAQADALRYLNKAYIASYGKGGPAVDAWTKVATDNRVSEARDFADIADTARCKQLPASVFALNLEKLDSNPVIGVVNITDPDAQQDTDKEPPTFARVRTDLSVPQSQGLWIEAVRSRSAQPSAKMGFYDFHIRACWQTPGQDTPVTLGTIVRLYDPAPSN